MSKHPDERFFESLARETGSAAADSEPAPSRLKSRIYSALLEYQAQSAPLLSLTETRASGQGLCVFEKLVEISPVPKSLKEVNLCRYCHARILAERWENAPIYWSHCPYVRFQPDRTVRNA